MFEEVWHPCSLESMQDLLSPASVKLLKPCLESSKTESLICIYIYYNYTYIYNIYIYTHSTEPGSELMWVCVIIGAPQNIMVKTVKS